MKMLMDLWREEMEAFPHAVNSSLPEELGGVMTFWCYTLHRRGSIHALSQLIDHAFTFH